MNEEERNELLKIVLGYYDSALGKLRYEYVRSKSNGDEPADYVCQLINSKLAIPKYFEAVKKDQEMRKNR
jgi:hypothetical protein